MAAGDERGDGGFDLGKVVLVGHPEPEGGGGDDFDVDDGFGDELIDGGRNEAFGFSVGPLFFEESG